MLEAKDYRAVDIELLIVCGFIYRMTGYTKSPKIITVHAMYSLLVSTLLPGSWKREGTSEKLKPIGTEVYEFIKTL